MSPSGGPGGLGGLGGRRRRRRRRRTGIPFLHAHSRLNGKYYIILYTRVHIIRYCKMPPPRPGRRRQHSRFALITGRRLSFCTSDRR